ncbi:MAG: hypothetical protein IT282_02660 [Bacteroidetes bacterium]|nr:hypothetical protein [Bacteroidota bacterium]
MDIRYIDPLYSAFHRMRRALFQPFDLKKWFVVGFTAFLAGLTEFSGNNGGTGGRFGDDGDLEDLLYFPQHVLEWISDNPGWFTLIVVGLILLVILGIVLTWISSRGKFMFLDNVIHDRAEVKKPWYEFKREGNSLFFWHLLFGFAMLVIVGGYLVSCYASVVAMYEHSGEFASIWPPLAGMILGFVAIMALVSFIDLLVRDFVVPIMYRSRIDVWAGWGTLFKLLWSNFFQFIGYAFFILLLWIMIVIGIVAAVVLTCCIGGVLLIIPYINAVALLPVTYTLRAFSLEFLGQFGAEYKLLPELETGTAPGGIHQP